MTTTHIKSQAGHSYTYILCIDIIPIDDQNIRNRRYFNNVHAIDNADVLPMTSRPARSMNLGLWPYKIDRS